MQNNLYNILQDSYGISEENIQEVLQLKQKKGGSFGELLVTRGMITENQMLEALSTIYDVPFWPELPLDNIDFDFTRHVPIHFLKKYNMVPLVIKMKRTLRRNPIPPINCPITCVISSP
jgi:hypothetical protein